jgi:hypothetical protein
LSAACARLRRRRRDRYRPCDFAFAGLFDRSALPEEAGGADTRFSLLYDYDTVRIYGIGARIREVSLKEIFVS